MRNRLAYCLLFLGLALSRTAFADTIYDVTLTGQTASANGTGSFTLNVDPSTASGVTTYTTNGSGRYQLLSFSVSIAGDTFNLANALSPTSVQFTNGKLTAVTYGSSIDNVAFQASGLTYGIFVYGNGARPQIGSIAATAIPSVSATPEPGSAVLFGSGLFAVLLAAWRQRSERTPVRAT